MKVGMVVAQGLRSRTFSGRICPACLSTYNSRSQPQPRARGIFSLVYSLTRIHRVFSSLDQNIISICVDGVFHIKVYGRVENNAKLGFLVRSEFNLKRQESTLELEHFWRLNNTVDCSGHQVWGIGLFDTVGVLSTANGAASLVKHCQHAWAL